MTAELATPLQVRDLGATKELLAHHLSDLDDILAARRIRNGACQPITDPLHLPCTCACGGIYRRSASSASMCRYPPVCLWGT